jgi:hypothetical protein
LRASKLPLILIYIKEMRKLYVVAIAIFSFLTACTKIESTDIGAGLIPTIDRVNTFDTLLDVQTSNYAEENVPRVYKSNDHAIGIINNDPLFGSTTASAYFELKPTFYPFYFTGVKNSISVDSAVLVLSYKGSFGDTIMSQTWNVREVGQKLQNDSAYPVNTTVATGALLGSKTFDVRRLADSVNNNFENAANQIRIPLSTAFANRLISYDSSASNNGAYASDSLFRESFRGFALVPQSGNALIRINLTDTNTKFAVYYHYKAADTSTIISTTVNYFRFNTGSTGYPTSANANVVSRNRTGSEAAKHLNTSFNDSLVYIQTSPGTFATVKIPGLTGFPNVIVHRAELIAEQVPENSVTDGYFFPPRYLLLSHYDGLNKYNKSIPNDFVYSATSGPNIENFGGLLTNKTVPAYGTVGSYSFNLSRYVQGIVTRKDTSYTLRISAPVNDSLSYNEPYPYNTSAATMLYVSPSVANQLAMGRVRLGGGTHSRVRMRLRIIYSKI